MREALKYRRKVFIFLLCLIAGMVGPVWMGEGHYTLFFDRLVWLAVGFFVGNGAEHIAGAFMRRDNAE